MISGIFFEASEAEKPDPARWADGYELLAAEMRRHSIKPEYRMIDNFGGPLKLQKFISESEKLTCGKFENVETIALVAAPSGTDKPAWSWFAQCGMSFQEGNYSRLSVTFLVDHEHCIFGSPSFDETVLALSSFFDWDFGWALARDKEKGVELYIGGGGAGDGFTPEDRRRTNAWYEAYTPQERRIRVRDIFPYNIIGPGHLAHALPDGRTLRAFIEADRYSALRSLAEDLWLWTVKSDRIDAIREKLRGSGVVISE